MAFFELQQVREVDWASTIDWDVRFKDAPAPFNEWFPATDVEENIATMNNHSIEAHMSTYEFPLGSAIFDLQVTFIDDVLYTIHDYLADWINRGILNGGEYLTPLRRAVRHCEVVRTDGTGRVIYSAAYWVTPEGGINWQGNSSADVASNSMRFPIAGTAQITRPVE